MFLLLVAAGLFTTSQSEGRTEVGFATGEEVDSSSSNITLTCDQQGDVMSFANQSRKETDGVDLMPLIDQACVDACKKGGSAALAYCASAPMPPQVKAACFAAAAAGTAACIAFCASR